MLAKASIGGQLPLRPVQARDEELTVATQPKRRVKSRAIESAGHVFEDVLLTLAIAAFGLDERITPDQLCDLIQTLMEAREEGRERELLTAAHEQAAALEEWPCAACGESNPGTFDICWACHVERAASPLSLQPQSEVLLACEAVVEHQVAVDCRGAD